MVFPGKWTTFEHSNRARGHSGEDTWPRQSGENARPGRPCARTDSCGIEIVQLYSIHSWYRTGCTISTIIVVALHVVHVGKAAESIDEPIFRRAAALISYGIKDGLPALG